MTQETRFNLIFLTVFVLISLPGAVILFRKKLDPKAPAMYLPKPVRPFMSVIDPRPAPPKVERVTGEVTLAWISQLGQGVNRAGDLAEGAAGMKSEEVSTSARRVFQVLAPDCDAEGCVVAGVVWRSKLLPDDPETDASVAWEVAGEEFGAARVAWEEIKVPLSVLAEQKELGFILPPKAVTAFRAEFESVSQASFTSAGSPGLFKLTCENCGLREPEAAEVPGPWPADSAASVENPLD